ATLSSWFLPSTADVAPVQTGDVFGLQGQIEHKLAFLREHVPRDTRLVLIGHSIGCYIILDMMKREPRLQVRVSSWEQVLKSVLLFPTIERMAATPQGRLMTPVLCRLRYATYLPVFLLSLLPLGLKTSIVKFALRGLSSLDPKITNAAVRLLSVDCVGMMVLSWAVEIQVLIRRDASRLPNGSVFVSEHFCQETRVRSALDDDTPSVLPANRVILRKVPGGIPPCLPCPLRVCTLFVHGCRHSCRKDSDFLSLGWNAERSFFALL
ncbi:hypothetical protein Z043_104450, partial [Scleropages formosus]